MAWLVSTLDLIKLREWKNCNVFGDQPKTTTCLSFLRKEETGKTRPTGWAAATQLNTHTRRRSFSYSTVARQQTAVRTPPVAISNR